jgi:hypothetical protein
VIPFPTSCPTSLRAGNDYLYTLTLENQLQVSQAVDQKLILQVDLRETNPPMPLDIPTSQVFSAYYSIMKAIYHPPPPSSSSLPPASASTSILPFVNNGATTATRASTLMGTPPATNTNTTAASDTSSSTTSQCLARIVILTMDIFVEILNAETVAAAVKKAAGTKNKDPNNNNALANELKPKVNYRYRIIIFDILQELQDTGHGLSFYDYHALRIHDWYLHDIPVNINPMIPINEIPIYHYYQYQIGNSDFADDGRLFSLIVHDMPTTNTTISNSLSQCFIFDLLPISSSASSISSNANVADNPPTTTITATTTTAPTQANATVTTVPTTTTNSASVAYGTIPVVVAQWKVAGPTSSVSPTASTVIPATTSTATANATTINSANTASAITTTDTAPTIPIPTAAVRQIVIFLDRNSNQSSTSTTNRSDYYAQSVKIAVLLHSAIFIPIFRLSVKPLEVLNPTPTIPTGKGASTKPPAKNAIPEPVTMPPVPVLCQLTEITRWLSTEIITTMAICPWPLRRINGTSMKIIDYQTFVILGHNTGLITLWNENRNSFVSVLGHHPTAITTIRCQVDFLSSVMTIIAGAIDGTITLYTNAKRLFEQRQSLMTTTTHHPPVILDSLFVLPPILCDFRHDLYQDPILTMSLLPFTYQSLQQQQQQQQQQPLNDTRSILLFTLIVQYGSGQKVLYAIDAYSGTIYLIGTLSQSQRIDFVPTVSLDIQLSHLPTEKYQIPNEILNPPLPELPPTGKDAKTKTATATAASAATIVEPPVIEDTQPIVEKEEEKKDLIIFIESSLMKKQQAEEFFLLQGHSLVIHSSFADITSSIHETNFYLVVARNSKPSILVYSIAKHMGNYYLKIMGEDSSSSSASLPLVSRRNPSMMKSNLNSKKSFRRVSSIPTTPTTPNTNNNMNNPASCINRTRTSSILHQSIPSSSFVVPTGSPPFGDGIMATNPSSKTIKLTEERLQQYEQEFPPSSSMSRINTQANSASRVSLGTNGNTNLVMMDSSVVGKQLPYYVDPLSEMMIDALSLRKNKGKTKELFNKKLTSLIAHYT